MITTRQPHPTARMLRTGAAVVCVCLCTAIPAHGSGKNKVLGESWYSVALFCDTAHVTGVSIVFANKGDLVTLAERYTESGDRAPKDEWPTRRAAALRTYVARIEAAARNIGSNLTSLLHAPATQQFGEGNQMTRETVKRWNVKGHARNRAERFVGRAV